MNDRDKALLDALNQSDIDKLEQAVIKIIESNLESAEELPKIKAAIEVAQLFNLQNMPAVQNNAHAKGFHIVATKAKAVIDSKGEKTDSLVLRFSELTKKLSPDEYNSHFSIASMVYLPLSEEKLNISGTRAKNPFAQP